MSHVARTVKLSVQVYGALTRLYPLGFRREYGGEMTQVFEECATDAWQQRQWRGLAAVWFHTLVDLLRSVSVEHVTNLRQVFSPPKAIAVGEMGTSSALAIHVTQRRSLVLLGTGFAVLNGLLWFCTPALRAAVDASAGRLVDPCQPYIIRGVQELLVYFDPWLAWYVFPPVFTIGFASIPFLWTSRGSDPSGTADSIYIVRLITTLLIVLEGIWLFLTWVGVCCRGPQWNFYWPGEAWDATRTFPLPTLDFSDFFWTSLFGISTQDMSWLLRESPGITLVAAYFIVGFFVVVRRRWDQAGRWPLAVTTFMLLLALTIPMKMCCRALWDLRYVVSIPELQINI